VRHGELFPKEVVSLAHKRKSPSIAYTYSEPMTFYEYMYDTARLARAAGLKNVIVSNGYINKEPFLRLCRYLDGANVNLKSFDDSIYRRLNGGELAPVLDTFRNMHREGVWFEMTTLVVPTYVDKPEMIKRMCAWILRELGPDYPLHLLRFFPHYKLTRLPATPIETLEELRDLAMKEGIRYVYLGNVPGHKGTHTYCHNCRNILVERHGYHIAQNNLEKGLCRFCGTLIPGRWE
jgi:pyruvate formate lyase activating enzyme